MRRCGSIPTTPQPSRSAATSSTTTTNTIAPSPITTKRCGSSPTTRSPIWIAAPPITSSRTSSPRSPTLSEAIKLDPKNARAYTNRGAAYKKLGRIDQAIADDSAAIKIDPLSPEFFDNRGLNYADNGDYDRAIADYDEAIKLKPQANFLTNRGDAYNHKGATTIAPSPITIAPSRSIRDFPRLQQSRRRLRQEGRCRPRHRRLSAGAAHQSAVRQGRAESRRCAAGTRPASVGRKSDSSVLPTFDCGAANLAVEKAICSDPDLSRLDREIDAAYKAALATRSGKAVTQLRQEQRDFIAATQHVVRQSAI